MLKNMLLKPILVISGPLVPQCLKSCFWCLFWQRPAGFEATLAGHAEHGGCRLCGIVARRERYPLEVFRRSHTASLHACALRQNLRCGIGANIGSCSGLLLLAWSLGHITLKNSPPLSLLPRPLPHHSQNGRYH